MAGGQSRVTALLELSPRHVVVPPSPPGGISFALVGNMQSWDQLGDWHSGVSNCKPGVWVGEARPVPNEDGEPQDYPEQEAVLRWVSDLDEDTKLDFSSSVEDWKAWDQRLAAKVDKSSSAAWSEGVVWKALGTYYDDGGIFNTLSTAYLTREAAVAIDQGGNSEDGEMEDDDYEGYLESISLNDAFEGTQRNPGFTLGGLHFGQDEIGGPPAVAVGERDGQVVAIKLFSDEDDNEEGFVFEGQPGKINF